MLRQRLNMFLVGVLTLQGCQHADRTSTPTPPLQEAAKAVDETNLSNSQVADLQIALARSMESTGENERVFNTYMAAVKRDPNRADACMRLAIHLDKQAKFEEAAAWYEKALKLAPNDSEIHANRGYSHYVQHDWELAEKHLRTAIELKPDHKQARNNLGLLLARRGQIDEALESFRQSGCSSAEARANIAFALALENRFIDAAAQYRLALAADANCAPARKGLERLEAIAQKADAAQRDVAKKQDSAPSPSATAAVPRTTLQTVGRNESAAVEETVATFSGQTVRRQNP